MMGRKCIFKLSVFVAYAIELEKQPLCEQEITSSSSLSLLFCCILHAVYLFMWYYFHYDCILFKFTPYSVWRQSKSHKVREMKNMHMGNEHLMKSWNVCVKIESFFSVSLLRQACLCFSVFHNFYIRKTSHARSMRICGDRKFEIKIFSILYAVVWDGNRKRLKWWGN